MMGGQQYSRTAGLQHPVQGIQTMPAQTILAETPGILNPTSVHSIHHERHPKGHRQPFDKHLIPIRETPAGSMIEMQHRQPSSVMPRPCSHQTEQENGIQTTRACQTDFSSQTPRIQHSLRCRRLQPLRGDPHHLIRCGVWIRKEVCIGFTCHELRSCFPMVR